MLRMKSNINPTQLFLFLQFYAALFSHLQVSEIDVHLTSKCVFNEIGFFFSTTASLQSSSFTYTSSHAQCHLRNKGKTNQVTWHIPSKQTYAHLCMGLGVTGVSGNWCLQEWGKSRCFLGFAGLWWFEGACPS